MSANLSRLTIGSLALTPAFDADVMQYSVATSNAKNTVTAVAEDEAASVSIVLNGETEVTSGPAVSWAEGENTLRISVANGDVSKMYEVLVTKA